MLNVVDNPVVILGRPQATLECINCLKNNEDGEKKLTSHPNVDPRDVKLEKYCQIFGDEDELTQVQMFEKMHNYGMGCILDSCYGVAEAGNVNNCPFDANGVNSEYKLDIGIINEKFQGMLH